MPIRKKHHGLLTKTRRMLGVFMAVGPRCGLKPAVTISAPAALAQPNRQPEAPSTQGLEMTLLSKSENVLSGLIRERVTSRSLLLKNQAVS